MFSGAMQNSSEEPNWKYSDCAAICGICPGAVVARLYRKSAKSGLRAFERSRRASETEGHCDIAILASG